MRKTQKQDILEIIKTLNEANEEVKNNIKAGSYAYAQDMLAQCQECAISIGNVIESAEGEGAATISYIEEYCDIVYQIHGELNGGGDANANKIYKNIRKQLLRIENSVRNDIPVRKEIAFFPYKASMWDSLESIYLAAKKDPGCDAYCVPIPYYDVNADGSLGQMHYEGREYPKNIEVIDWEKYDLENRKPDVAYIHNPYDEYNLVTRVHSRFFSSNIKKYVDELVYIPYFVLAEIEPDNQNAIDGMKHFIWLPGVVNADKVIVQSEKMAQIYRNEFRKAAIANGLPEQFISKAALEKKILGLGSPKIEKVKNTKKEDLEIPQEWQKIINRPDGSRKKIVFYNTSIGALLANNGKMLEKMKDVFRIFKEHRDEIALLWRPHPLIENTVKSMRPQLWGEYKKIVEQYKAEGWGIYDDTSDMDRAVVLSDAYYGDGSSVVQLYKQTGKPIMMQNVDVRQIPSDKYYLVNSLCEDEGSVYFVPYNLNVLVKYSEAAKRSEWVRSIADVGQERFVSYNDIKKYRDKLFLIPLHDTKIVVYDLKSEAYECIPIPPSEHWDCSWGNFSKAYQCGENLYLVGYQYPGVIRLNMETYECEQALDLYTIHEQDMGQQRLALESVEKNDCIYMLVQDTSELVKYGMKDHQSTIYHLEYNGRINYRTIAFDGNDFWFTQDGIEYLKWNEESQKGEVLVHPGKDKIPRDSLYRFSFFKAGKIYVMSSIAAPIVIIDCNDFKQSTLMWKEEGQEKGFRVFHLFKYNGGCAFIDFEDQCNRVLDIQICKAEKQKWIKDKDKIVQTLAGQENEIVRESGASLPELIGLLAIEK
ncbi:MAG: CDP-glycerol glycerophosphotransferase family protein [Lachnospiraceae bacterium]|nr:CDP-glycerol glycerophosphotransferase family protein [Lachnospiraceae bacterium]